MLVTTGLGDYYYLRLFLKKKKILSELDLIWKTDLKQIFIFSVDTLVFTITIHSFSRHL